MQIKVLEKSTGDEVTPSVEKRKVSRLGRTNASVRSREYLTPAEVERLLKGARSNGRHAHRDATLLDMAYRHGLRVGELVALKWSQVDLEAGQLHVVRLKRGTPSLHDLARSEIRALRRLQGEQTDGDGHVFTSERGGAMTTDNVRKLVQRAGIEAGLGGHIHPHQLRHSAGFKLASDNTDTRRIQRFLGHRNIAHTVVYTELADGALKGIWKE